MEAQLFKSPTYAFLAVAMSGQGPQPDFNNGPGDYSNNSHNLATWRLFESDSNNGLILAPGVYSSQTRIMAPPQAIPILCQIEAQLFKSPTYAFLAVAISGLTSIMAQVTQIMAAFWPPAFIRV